MNRPFAPPQHEKIGVKVISPHGDEVMKFSA